MGAQNRRLLKLQNFLELRAETVQPKTSESPRRSLLNSQENSQARGKSLEELDQESDRLREKIDRTSSRMVEVHAINDFRFDHPMVKKLGKQILTLREKLRTISMQRSELRK